MTEISLLSLDWFIENYCLDPFVKSGGHIHRKLQLSKHYFDWDRTRLSIKVLSIYNINIIINDVIMKALMKYYQLDYVMSFQKENFDIIKKILIRLGMLQNSYQSSE